MQMFEEWCSWNVVYFLWALHLRHPTILCMYKMWGVVSDENENSGDLVSPFLEGPPLGLFIFPNHAWASKEAATYVWWRIRIWYIHEAATVRLTCYSIYSPLYISHIYEVHHSIHSVTTLIVVSQLIQFYQSVALIQTLLLCIDHYRCCLSSMCYPQLEILQTILN